jgi:orotate phosphoribosyltransferase-like protein
MSASDVKKTAAMLSDPTMTKTEVAEHFRVSRTTHRGIVIKSVTERLLYGIY